MRNTTFLKTPSKAILVLCLAVLLLASTVAWGVFEAVPHLEDEQANYFQAKLFATGKVTNSSPEPEDAFSIPFVVNREGRQFSKYSPGYSLMLALGMLVGQPWLVNSLAAALGILACFLLGKELFSPETGLLAAALGAVSPMFIMLSGTYLSNISTLAALTLFAWAFLRAMRSIVGAERGTFALATGGLLGLGFITRPYTAAAIGLPFFLLALFDLARRSGDSFPVYLRMAFAFILVGSILPLYNLAATGSPFTNTYTLWWKYDGIGFGPQFGRYGHTWAKVLINLRADLPIFNITALGWPVLLGLPVMWGIIGLGLFLKPRQPEEWALLAPPLVLIVTHFAYWAHSGGLYGVRYYTEALPYLWILAARALLKIGRATWGRQLVKIALPIFTAWSLFVVIVPRFSEGHGLYNISRRDAQIIANSGIDQAIVFVRGHHWTDYASLSWLNDQELESSDIIFARDLGDDKNGQVIERYPQRKIYFYDRSQRIPLSLYPDTETKRQVEP